MERDRRTAHVIHARHNEEAPFIPLFFSRHDEVVTMVGAQIKINDGGVDCGAAQNIESVRDAAAFALHVETRLCIQKMAKTGAKQPFVGQEHKANWFVIQFSVH